MFRAHFFRFCLICASTLLLSACVTGGSSPVFQTTGPTTDITVSEATTASDGSVNLPRPNGPASAGTLREGVKVAMLVPQTGPNAALGNALLQAAQLAVFDINEPMFQLVPKDTQGTAEGAARAADEAVREGARLILGPVFAGEVDAARKAARPYGVNVIGFSTDWRVAGDNAFIMGVLPFGQVERIAEYAARQGVRRVAVIAGNDMYGDAVLSLFQTAAQRNGMTLAKVARVSPDGRDVSTAVSSIAAGLKTDQPAYDALFVPLGGQAIRIAASVLKNYGLAGGRIKLLGTGLWDDPAVLSDPNMSGALYAAPAPQVRASFERNYQRVYGSLPPRLASIGYDSAALAIIMARTISASGQRVSYDRNAFLNPNGFSGIDGIFRFKGNGLVERGMAVLQVGGGSSHLVDPAPNSFLGFSR